MRRRRPVPQRRAIFVRVEGQSELAFVRFLGKCCERQSLHLHVDARPANGGDSVAVVEAAARYVRRHPGHSRKLVLLDEDRLEQDRQAGRDARKLADISGLDLVLQCPNLEGLLLRLHPGHEHRRIRRRKQRMSYERSGQNTASLRPRNSWTGASTSLVCSVQQGTTHTCEGYSKSSTCTNRHADNDRQQGRDDIRVGSSGFRGGEVSPRRGPLRGLYKKGGMATVTTWTTT